MLFIFDMGGVVTTTFEMNCLYEFLKLKPEDFFAVCKNPFDIWKQLECGKISVADFWKEFNRRVEQFKNDSALKNIFSDDADFSVVPEVTHDLFRLYFHPVLNEETVKIIQALRKKHRVVCGTNTIQSHWENHIERGDYTFFDQTYASNKIGESKPDASYFKLILEAEGVKPEEAFFTDDRSDNCKAAESVGIHSVQFTDAASLYEEWKKYF